MRGFIRWGFISAMTLLSVNLILPLLFGAPLKPDFVVLWAAARATNPYDLHEVAGAEAWLWNASAPFINPPSAMPLLFPFGLLSFWTAFTAWTLLSIAAFWAAGRSIAQHAWLAFLSPHVVLAGALGQSTLLVGAAILAGVSRLRSAPILAGAFFGIGFAIKPQSLLLAPIVLLAGRHWKALGGMVFVWSMLALSALPLWPAWLRSLGQFPGILAHFDLYRLGATPTMLATALGAQSVWPVQIVGLLVGSIVAITAFRSEKPVTQAIGLIGGTLIASPYAMRYELAPLVPALIALAMTGTARGGLVAAPLLCLNVFTIVPALLLSSFCNIWRQWNSANRTRFWRFHSSSSV